MKRRDFLKISGSAIGLATIGGNLKALDLNDNSISIDIVTDKPGLAENFLNKIIPLHFSKPVSFKTKRIVGKIASDICIIKNGRLIDYRSDRSPISESIRELARKLQVPYTAENQHLLTLRIGDSSNFDYFEICKENKIIERIPVADSPQDLIVTSNYGEVKFEFSGSSARATQASCTHKNCISTGSIKQSGQNIICIPSRISLTTSKSHGTYDAFSR